MKGIIEKVKRAGCLFMSAAVVSTLMPFSAWAYTSGSKSDFALEQVIGLYKEENPQIKDGLSLCLGDSRSMADILNLSESAEDYTVESMDEDIVSVGGGMITACGEGDTYIALKTGGRTFIYGVEVISPVPVLTADSVEEDDDVQPLKSRYVVFLDAGHGGLDPGATGCGLVEKDLTLDITKKVQAILEGNDVDVIMRRNDDTYTDYKEIRGILNSTNSDLSVSIHINACDDPRPSGIETYYADTLYLSQGINDESKKLAEKIQGNLISGTKANNRGVKKDDFSVISNTNVPAALTECGFITNSSDAALLRTNSYKQLLASGIAEAVMSYLKENVSLSNIDGVRIYGDTRYQTSFRVARMGWTKADTVVIASGLDYPDALCASPLAALNNAPILLATDKSLSVQKDLSEIIDDLGVKKAYIVGGTSVISDGFEKELKEKKIAVKRLGGASRYDTSVLIAEEVSKLAAEKSISVTEAAVTSGTSFADSLSISPVAAKRVMPILLTGVDSIPQKVLKYMDAHNIENSYVIGGNAVISDAAAEELPNPVRLAGADRYITNEAVFIHFQSEIDLSNIYVAVGTNFPDALSVSPLAGREGRFVVLSEESRATKSLNNIIAKNADDILKVYALGGPAVLSDCVFDAVGVKLR